MFDRKDREIDKIRAELDRLFSSLEMTTIYKNKNDLQLSDAKRRASLAKQNIKYLKQQKIISAKTEYERALKDLEKANEDINNMEYQDRKLSESLVKLEKYIAEQKVLLEIELDKNTPKILEFRRKDK